MGRSSYAGGGGGVEVGWGLPAVLTPSYLTACFKYRLHQVRACSHQSGKHLYPLMLLFGAFGACGHTAWLLRLSTCLVCPNVKQSSFILFSAVSLWDQMVSLNMVNVVLGL